jgi:hypothetical protein
MNYTKLLEMNSFFTLHSFLEVGKTHDLPSKFWQTLRNALRVVFECLPSVIMAKMKAGILGGAPGNRSMA